MGAVLAPAPMPQDSSDTSTTGRHLPALDGLRGLAVLTVVFAHLLMANDAPTGSALIRLFAHIRAAGWVGVDLFFVLSGFLITGILYDTLSAPHFLRNFYARRMLRIFPLYYGVLAVCITFSLLLGSHWTLEVWRVLTYTQNLHLTSPPAATDSGWFVVGHFWSLAVEEQFYFLWPLAVFLLRTRRRIAIGALAGAAASLCLRLYFAHSGMDANNPLLLVEFTPARVDGLLLGAALAMAIRSSWRPSVLRVAPWLGAFCALVICALATHLHGFNWADKPTATWGLSVLDLGCAALLASALRAGGPAQLLLQLPPMRFFGRYSYGMYVYHLTVAALVGKLLLRSAILARTGSKLLSVLTPGLLAFALTVAVAWLSFRFYESRFLQLKRRFHDSTHRRKLHDFVR